ncbi:mitochondrial amidoxime reducing component 2-like [Ipomoea triloba]|uniref:mitochondrial amidoxime reducing component 2-like n=1 Tax=Ipomoea triloba TaxID=35885 RepID=UPI00125E0120|nr:mitochondrial amidoxime reducing component 2-like [Ipomoea triloba]
MGECEAAAKVCSILIYPLKSCRGISVPEAALTSTGFRWDRQWMVVNARGRACTQKVEPSLTLVEPELPHEAFSEGWEPKKGSFLVIKAPGMDVLKIPLVAPSAISNGVSVWEWSGSALDEGDRASEWFTKFLGKPCRLVRFNEATENRSANPSYASGYHIKFNDAFPYLLASQKSLDALNEQLEEPVSIMRFRANIIVEDCEAYAEDLWKEMKINGLTFHSSQLCYRCKVTRVHPETAALGPEPLETLSKFRSNKVLHPERKPLGRIYFGQYVVCTDCSDEGKKKSIRVGDSVHVLKMVSSYADVSV